MEDADPRIEAHYDDLAPFWADLVEGSNRDETLWATLEDLLPPLDGLRVLDAGCGSGVYAAHLLERGADVVGVDVSEAMVEGARDRAPEATFLQADLSEPLDGLETGGFDAVVCQHAFSHLPELDGTVGEFERVLTDGGALVVSTHNPVFDYVVVRDREHPSPAGASALETTVSAPDGAPAYHETERYDVRYEDEDVDQRATYYRRPVEALFRPLLDAGFALEDVVEPASRRDATDGDRSRGAEPDEARRDASSTPDGAPDSFPAKSLCVRASKRAADSAGAEPNT